MFDRADKLQGEMARKGREAVKVRMLCPIPYARLVCQTGGMIEPNGEVERAVSALASEILKLSPLEGEARDALGVTIENALSRLVIAIQAQSACAPAKPMPLPSAEYAPPPLTGPN